MIYDRYLTVYDLAGSPLSHQLTVNSAHFYAELEVYQRRYCRQAAELTVWCACRLAATLWRINMSSRRTGMSTASSRRSTDRTTTVFR